MRAPQSVIKRPLLTEKSARLRETGGGAVAAAEGEEYGQKVLFEVARDANKIELDGKTKSVATALKALGAPQPTTKTLIVDAKTNATLSRGAKNLPSSQWIASEGINVYDILRHEILVLTQDAAKAITTAILGEKE